MDRFVSSLGVNRPPTGHNVRYLKSCSDYGNALEASKSIRLDEGVTIVIYRLSYDPIEDEFFSYRQIAGKDAGNQKSTDDPTDKALAYEIFTAPRALIDGDKATLNQQIDLIAKRSQMDRPGPARPN